MRVLFIGPQENPFVESLKKFLVDSSHYVEHVSSGIEGNDVILAAIATGQPYHLIMLHDKQNTPDTRDLISYWRSQDPFLPVVLVSPETVSVDSDMTRLGLLDVLTEGTPSELLINRLRYLDLYMVREQIFRLKAEILDRLGRLADPHRAVGNALELMRRARTERRIAFIYYTDVADEPLVQMAEDLDVREQAWFDRICSEPQRYIEPILMSGRMSFESDGSSRYLFPIVSDRGWEGLLIFFSAENDESGNVALLTGQFQILADGIRGMLEHVRAKQELDRIKQSESEYFSIISNNLDTAMSEVSGSTELLGMVEVEPHVKSQIDRLSHNVKVAVDILADTIELGRIDKGMVVIHTKPVPLQNLIEEIAIELDPNFPGPDATIEINAEAHEDYEVEGDSNKLRKVFVNILDNAIRFSPEGCKITVSLSYDATGWVVASVRDLGMGIPESQLETIFNRVSLSHDGIVSGKGIGLFICRKFIKAHEGQIWVESKPGSGTTFFVRLRVSM